MTYKAVIFDLDGTLLNTIEDLSDSMNTVLMQSGFPIHKADAYKYFVGNGLINLVRRALPEANRDEATVKKMLFEMKTQYENNWDKKSHLYDGIPELLNGLAQRELLLCVLSNKADKFTKLILSKFFHSWNFKVVFGEREGVPRKPDPTAALEISEILCIPPSEFLYLGDSGVDMMTANSAGMFAVGALWGFRSENELLENGAKALIRKPTELLSFL